MPPKPTSDLIELNPENLTHGHWQRPGEARLPVLSVAQIRAVEAAAFAEIDSFVLMQAAGLRTAHKLLDQFSHSASAASHMLVLAGPGNNGGDAFIVAGALHRAGMNVRLIDFAEGVQSSTDRQRAAAWCEQCGITPQPASELSPPLHDLPRHAWVIDGLIGIAGGRALQGAMLAWVEHIHSLRACQPLHVVALDCPSGLNCDNGQTQGPCLQADVTFTYLALKPGLLTNEGKSLAGELWVDALGCEALIRAGLQQHMLGEVAHTASRTDQLARLPQRKHQHHKGSFGSLGIVGGQAGMVGACVLSARAALHMGVGRVALTLLAEHGQQWPDVQIQGSSAFLDILCPEVMNKPLQENLQFADVLVLGPGLGQSDQAIDLLLQVLNADQAHHMVWDADALNILAKHEGVASALRTLRATHPDRAMVLTPHPLEAARLLRQNTEHIQADRLGNARALAAKYAATVVLKGAGTVIADPQGLEINLSGGPALATAGSGDVLAGAIAALLGQGLKGFDAACLAVHVHGASVEPLGGSDEGLLVSHASEISLRMKQVLNRLLHQGTR
ncbi:NAD(P)H-hydrate dehydratase [Limnobacter sp.]